MDLRDTDLDGVPGLFSQRYGGSFHWLRHGKSPDLGSNKRLRSDNVESDALGAWGRDYCHREVTKDVNRLLPQ